VPLNVTAVWVTEQSGDSPRRILGRRRITDVLAVLLQDLPKRMSRRLLRSVTWTEVAAEIPLSTLPGRVARLGRRLVNLRTIPWISRHS
jgi:hypothetical protein